MDEERPLKEAREALSQQEAGESPEISNLETKVSETSPAYQSSAVAGRPGPQTGLIIGGIVVVVILIIVGLFLPPISLGERLGLTSGDGVASAGAGQERSISESVLSIPGEVELSLDNQAPGVQVAKVGKDVFLNKQTDDVSLTAAADAIPGRLNLASDVYTIAYEGTAPGGTAEISIPAAAQPYQTLDLYGWFNDNWRFIASSVDSEGGLLTSASGSLPQALALMQTAISTEPEVGADLLPTQSIPVEMLPQLTEVSAGTLTLGQNGALAGEIVSVPNGGYRTLARVTNTGAIVDTVSLSALLSDPASQAQHNETLLNAVKAGGFAGVNLDYQGVDPDQKAAFSTFVGSLA